MSFVSDSMWLLPHFLFCRYCFPRVRGLWSVWKMKYNILYIFIRALKFYLKLKISCWLTATFKQIGLSIQCLVTTLISSVRKINISQQSTVSAFNKYIKEKLVVNQLCEEIHSIVCEIVIFINLLYHLRQFHLSYNSKPETVQNVFMKNLFFFFDLWVILYSNILI